jgi:hypothetical protein
MMPKKKSMKKKMPKKVDDLSIGNKMQSKAMNLDEKNPKLAKCAERKVKAR